MDRRGAPLLTVSGLHAGYGKMEVLHGIDLELPAGGSICLVGPNGAGKSTVLHAVYGLAGISQGCIRVGDIDVTRRRPSEMLAIARVAFVMQDNSVFSNMTVEENLWMGGFLLASRTEAREAAERVLQRYPRLAARRHAAAGALSGGERRLLEIARALIMAPRVLLVDEPSIGLEPRYVDWVFEILADLQHTEGMAVLLVEQNAKTGLAFAETGYVLVAGSVARRGAGRELLEDPELRDLYLGG